MAALLLILGVWHRHSSVVGNAFFIDDGGAPECSHRSRVDEVELTMFV